MRYRLLAPVGVAGAIALAAWVPTVTSAAAATPSLPQISAGQLLVKARAANVKGFSGTVRWTANLGLPALSTLTGGAGGNGGGNAFDPTSLLSGSHDISVWDGGAGQQRLALPGSLSEVDVVHNGSQLSTYDSSTQRVTDYTGLPTSAGRQAPTDATGTPLTPDQAAQKLLSNLDPSTAVSVVSPVYVAHQAAYQLVLTPKAAQSTVGSVTIAVDAANGMPLQVQVLPQGSKTPALSLGYTDLLFAMPSASNFAAPVGSSTVTKAIGHGSDTASQPPATTALAITAPATTGSATSGHPTTIGSGWATIGVFGGVSTKVSGELSKVGYGLRNGDRLLTSSLLNALLLPDGKVLVGFVTPATLEAAAPTAG